ncbi:MAG: hypothetical protein HFJ17_02290 [Clostridia bacterium]|nr:hypothetical protein [Clostridia bacterium]
MKCENCGRNEANVKYTQIINGDKKQMFLCEECSQKLGIGNMNFNMPIDFSSFLGDFFDDMNTTSFIPTISNVMDLKCKKCGLDFDEFLHTGRFGCSNCYDEFESMIDPILKNIHGSNRHIGRLGKVVEGNNISNDDKVSKNVEENNVKEENKIDKLKRDLKQAIKDERYEDAAKLRDEIKNLEEK